MINQESFMSTAIEKLLLLVCLTALAPASGWARQTSPPPVTAIAPTNALGPRIQFAKSEYDFGRAKAGEPVKYTYAFTNTGDQVLQVTGVHACGCISADWTKQVEPGKTGSIPIQFNTLGYNGPVFKQVSVNCNVTNQPIVFLQLKGTVYKPVDVIPAMAVLNVSPDNEKVSVSLTITNNTEEPLLLTGVEVSTPAFSAQLVTNQPGKGYQVTVSTVPPLSPGSVQGQLVLKTSWTNTPLIPVTVVANVQPAVVASPGYVTLAPAPLRTAVTSIITLQSTSATNLLTFSDAAVNAPGVTVALSETTPGKTFSARLEFPQGFGLTPGKQVEFSVKTSHPKYPLIKVPIVQLPSPPAPAAPASPTPAAVPVPAQPPATPPDKAASVGGWLSPTVGEVTPAAK
jgi:hypothetical protein